jgi:hypothetical protein
VSEELAHAAARLVVDEGLEYGPAKRKAARALGLDAQRAAWPSNEAVEEAVREHLALFHADTQPGELAALRAIALQWMQRLQAFRPHLTGAVWRGTATRLSPVHLQLYCDDSKAAEIELINRGVDYQVGSLPGPRGDGIDVLMIEQRAPELGGWATLWLSILDHGDLRGALKPDAGGRSQRGDQGALGRLLAAQAEAVAGSGLGPAAAPAGDDARSDEGPDEAPDGDPDVISGAGRRRRGRR